MNHLARMICVREDWGIYCGAVPLASTADLPQRSAAAVRALIRNSPYRGFLVEDLCDLASRANQHGIKELPISVYRPGQPKGNHWQHTILTTA